jgi:hypothetical protein
MNGALIQLEREAARVCELIRRLEEIPVQDAAKLLKKSPKWIRTNLPIIVHGPRSRHVRAIDVEAYQLKRTVWPAGEFPGRTKPTVWPGRRH